MFAVLWNQMMATIMISQSCQFVPEKFQLSTATSLDCNTMHRVCAWRWRIWSGSVKCAKFNRAAPVGGLSGIIMIVKFAVVRAALRFPSKPGNCVQGPDNGGLGPGSRGPAICFRFLLDLSSVPRHADSI